MMSDQEIEQKKELKDLSKECQKAVKQFKAFLKKHVAKDFSNVDVHFSTLMGDNYGIVPVMQKGEFISNPKILYDIHLLDYKERCRFGGHSVKPLL